MHIVFEQEDAKTLTKSFDLDNSLRQKVIEIKDDYSLGPIKEIDSEEGLGNRKEWWMKVSGENLGDQANSVTEEDEITIKSIRQTLGFHKSIPVKYLARWVKIALARLSRVLFIYPSMTTCLIIHKCITAFILI